MHRSFPVAIAAALVSLVVLTGPAAQAALGGGGGKPKAVALNDASDLSQVYELAVTPPKFTKYFKPSKRIAITSFRVKLSSGAEQSSTRRSFLGGGGTSSSTLAFELQGLTPATAQSIADHLYEEYVKLLAARGYEVVPASELEANADYRKLVGKGTSGRESGGTLSGNAALVGVAKAANFDVGGFQMGSIKTEQNLSVALNAMVLHVNLGVNFASLKELSWFEVKTAGCVVDESGQCSQLGAGMKGELRQSLAPAGADTSQVTTNVDVITQWTFDQYLLKSTVVLPAEVIDSVEKKPETAGGAAAKLLGGLSGNNSSSTTYTVKVTSDYEEKVTHDLKRVLEMLSVGLPAG